MSEQVAREQDARITELIDAFGTDGFRPDDEALEGAKDALHEAIAEIRGESDALLDALARILRDIGTLDTESLRYSHGPSVDSTEPAFALLRKHGRTP